MIAIESISEGWFFIRTIAIAVIGVLVSHMSFGAIATLRPTPRMTEGPFYPDRMPSDTDNDLLYINQNTESASGQPVMLAGRVLTAAGEPVAQATVEIWQVDAHGVYLHSQCPGQEHRDTHFQGFGRCLTGSAGEYAFRTVVPVPYNFGIGRAPHIHIIVRQAGRRMLTTQLYIKDHPTNNQDMVLADLTLKARAAVMTPFKPVPDSTMGELAARFDLVIGTAAEDPAEDRLRQMDGVPQ